MLSNCGAGEDSWESFVHWGDQTNQSWRKSILNIHWKDWCWSWSSNSLATWCKVPDAKKDWGQEEKGATEDDMVGWHHRLNGHEFEQTLGDSEGEGRKPGVLQSMGSQRVRHDFVTEEQQVLMVVYDQWSLILLLQDDHNWLKTQILVSIFYQ